MKNVLLAFMFLCTFALQSQTAPAEIKIGTVTGRVIDKSLGEPIPYAAVVIRNKADNATVTGGITQEDGTFEVTRIPEGDFIFEVQFIGYKTFVRDITISRSDKNIDLGTITLEEDVAQLEGVDVVAERSTIEQKVDRKVINVGKDLTTAGATASDIMNNIPSVNVDQQTGDISLRGNSNVRVMVDGKLSNVPVAQLLKQIPSTSIKRIELITNPSAKYNPEGMSGIINIVLHKNANIGFNGNINLGLTKAEEAKFNSSIDLNYRDGKFNLYGNYGNNIGKYVNWGDIYQVEDNSRQLFNFHNNNKSHLYKVGVDFYLNEKNTLSFFTNQNRFEGKGTGRTRIFYYDDLTRNNTQYFDNINANRSEQYNFDYKLQFGREGHSIELEIDHNRFTNDEDADFRYAGNTGLQDYMDFVDTRRHQTTVNLDYVNPLTEKSKLELGAEARLFKTEVDYTSTGMSLNSGGVLVPTPGTVFEYGMDIWSAYATYGRNYDKWSYQVGARFENVEVVADTNSVAAFTHKYFQVYPSVFLTYNPSEKNSYQLSFSRRVDRPGLGQVNPIREWSTPLVSSYGNERLVPQFTNSAEINYTRRLKNGSVTAGVFYRMIEDEINRALYIDRLDLDKLILTYDNFDNTSAYGFEFSANYRPAKWWSINGSFDVFSQTQRGFTESLPPGMENPQEGDIVIEELQVENTAWNLRMNNNFTLTKKLSLSVFGFYRGKNRNIQFNIEPMYFVNTGLRYAFAEGKGTLSLNFNDIFNTMQFKFIGERPYIQEGNFNWESDSVYMGVSYRFGSGKNRALRRKNRDDNTKQGSGGIL